MRRRLPFIALCFLSLTAIKVFAQSDFDIVDRNKVEQLVDDASLATFYPTLLERFNAFDTTLTLSDYRLLYYGFVFQPTYSEYADQKKKEMNVALQAEKYTEVIQMADSVLQSIPVSLTANYLRGCAMFSSNENDSSYLKYINRYTRLRDAILSSGDGQHCNTAFKTIYIADEYEIMYRYFEIDGKTSQNLEYPCDRFRIEPSAIYQNTEIFFDTSESIRSIQKELNPSSSR